MNHWVWKMRKYPEYTFWYLPYASRSLTQFNDSCAGKASVKFKHILHTGIEIVGDKKRIEFFRISFRLTSSESIEMLLSLWPRYVSKQNVYLAIHLIALKKVYLPMIKDISPTSDELILIGTTFCDVTMKQQALLLSTLLRSSFVRPHFILKIKEENTIKL